VAARSPRLARHLVRHLSSSTPPPSKQDGAGVSDVTSSIKNMIGGADPARQRAAEKLVEVQKKGGSFGEALRGGIQKYETARKDEAFNVETKRLLALESFEWTNLRTLMEEAAEQADAKGIKQKIALNVDKYLRGGTQTEQLEAIKKEVKNYLVVIDELTPHEKRCHALLTKRARQLIAKRVGFHNVKVVNDVIERYEFLKVQHGWLRRQAARGLRLPADPQELGWMMRQFPTREYMHFMKQVQFKTASRKEKMSLKRTTKAQSLPPPEPVTAKPDTKKD